jgi:hypothetical protein
MIFETSMFIAMVWRYAQRPHKNVSRANTLLNAVFNNAVVYFTVSWFPSLPIACSTLTLVIVDSMYWSRYQLYFQFRSRVRPRERSSVSGVSYRRINADTESLFKIHYN